jgi:hypothetical protein
VAPDTAVQVRQGVLVAAVVGKVVLAVLELLVKDLLVVAVQAVAVVMV